MTERRALLLGLVALGSPQLLRAQAAQKVWRVGYLSLGTPEGDERWVMAMRQRLNELGYVEGRNLVFEQRHAFNQVDKVRDLTTDLLRRKVDVLVVYGSPAIAAVKAYGSQVPIVMTVHADPVGSGIVQSLARPGGNVTGLTDGHADLAPKRLEVLKEVVPSVSRVAVIFNPATSHALRQWQLAQAAAPKLGLTVIPIEVNGPPALEAGFASMVKQRANAAFLAPDPSWWNGQESRIANLAIKHRLPSIGTVREFAEHGILIAYGTNFTELWRRCAVYVDKIFKGAKPADLAIEHPVKFDLVINLKTAKTLGVTIPQLLLTRADDVIQ
jgi:putative ABC transport system substrate-binding protein